MRSSNAPDYLLGHASHEQQRLIEQARFIDGLTAQLFRAAGLREGMQVLERGAKRGVCDWIAGITRTVLPATEKFGIASAEEIDIETLSERLRSQALQLDATLMLFSFIGAWSRVQTRTGDCS
jgi:hypothetical protein